MLDQRLWGAKLRSGVLHGKERSSVGEGLLGEVMSACCTVVDVATDIGAVSQDGLS